MQVKLEVVECKNSKIKQAGLWNDSKSCCSWNREGTGKPENKCARNITVIIHVEFRAPSVSHLDNMESVIVLLGNKRVKRKKKKKCYCKVPKRLKIALLT